MSNTWQTVRVFISSTFRDMHSERDWLVKRVFPALRERLEKYRVYLVDIDLRWGVTEQQAENGGALDVCLGQIDECRPFFLGLLGERYGWVPQELSERVTSKYGWIQRTTKKSVTELEILYGVLNDPEMHEYSYFCFRDPKILRELPGEQVRNWVEFPTDDERRTLSRREARAHAIDRRRKLRELKQAIRTARLPTPPIEYTCRYAGLKINWRLARLELSDADRQALEEVARDGRIDSTEYADLNPRLQELVHRFGTVQMDGLQEFGERVGEWLWESIRRRLDLPEQPPVGVPASAGSLLAEEDDHKRFMESRLRVYVGRDEINNSLFAFADGNDLVPCLVTGPSGSGKSAALAKFVTAYRETHPDVLVMPHFIGASPASTNLRRLLRRLCLMLKGAFGFADEVSRDFNALATLFRGFLKRIPTEHRTVIVLDALNQLDETDNPQNLNWLPIELPGHVKLVASCIDDGDQSESIIQAFTHRPHNPVPVPALDNNEQRQIIRNVPSLSAKLLDDVQVELLLSNPATSNPLFLLVTIEELRGFGSFEQLDRRIVEFPRPVEEVPRWQNWLITAKQAAAFVPDEQKRHAYLKRLAQIESALDAATPVDDALTAVFLQVIDRLESDFDPQVSHKVLSLLASARRGLTDGELLELVEGPGIKILESKSDLFPLLRQLRSYLLSRAGLIGFYHQNLFQAVLKRYLDTAPKQEACHRRLALYFYDQPLWLLDPGHAPNSRKTDELPWQLIHAQCFEMTPSSNLGIETVLSDRDFLEAKCSTGNLTESGGVYDLLEDFQMALTEWPRNPATEPSSGFALLQGLQQAIRARFHTWADDPSRLYPQLYSHLMATIGDGDVAAQQWAERYRADYTRRGVWFRQVNRAVAHSQADLTIRTAGATRRVAFAQGGSVAVGAIGARLVGWAVENGREIFCRELGSPAVLIRPCPPDGEVLVLCQRGNVFRMNARGELRELPGTLSPVHTADLDPSSGLLAVADPFGQVLMWNLVGGNCIGRIATSRTPVDVVCFSAAGDRLLVVRENRLAVSYDTVSIGDRRAEVSLPPVGKGVLPRRVTCAVAGEQRVGWYLGLGDGKLLRWDGPGVEPAFLPETGTAAVTAVTASAGWVLAADRDGLVRQWLEEDEKFAGLVSRGGVAVLSLAQYRDRAMVAIAREDQTIQIAGWDVSGPMDEEQISTAPGWTSDGLNCVVGTIRGPVRLLGPNGEQVCATIGSRRFLTGLVSSTPSVHRWVASVADGFVLFDLEAKKYVADGGAGGSVKAVALAPGGNTVATGYDGGTCIIWDAESGGELGRHGTHHGAVTALAYLHPLLLVTGGEDGTLAAWQLAVETSNPDRVWEMRSAGGRTLPYVRLVERKRRRVNRPRRNGMHALGIKLGLRKEHPRPVNSLAATPDGSGLVVAVDDTPTLWSGITLRPVATLPPANSPLATIQVSPDGSSLLGLTRTGRCILWSLEERRIICQFQVAPNPLGCCWRPDGRVAAVTADGALALLDLEGFRPGPPTVRATRASRSAIPEVICPHGHPEARFPVLASQLGTVVACPKCSELVRLAPRAVSTLPLRSQKKGPSHA